VAKREEAALEFIFGLIVLALDIWAIVNVIGSPASTGSKILWTLLIIILPVVGFIIWFFAGPRSRSSAA
jgi:Phospholipase_D-nuclease N-terminal